MQMSITQFLLRVSGCILKILQLCALDQIAFQLGYHLPDFLEHLCAGGVFPHGVQSESSIILNKVPKVCVSIPGQFDNALLQLTVSVHEACEDI